MWAVEAFKVEAKKVVSYRLDFWVQFIVTGFAEIAIAYFLWKNVFTSATQTIGGYDFQKMMMYYILVPLVTRVVRSQDDWSTSKEIYDGTLNRYLIYPVSFMQYKFIQKTAFSFLSSIQMALAIAVIQFFVPLDVHVKNFLLGLLCCYSAFVVYFFMNIAMEFFAFWADAVWSLGVMLRFVAVFLGGGFIPLNLFPEKIQHILEFTPFPYLFYAPIRIMLGDIPTPEALRMIAICAAWIFPCALIVNWQLKQGLEKYTGVGI